MNLHCIVGSENAVSKAMYIKVDGHIELMSKIMEFIIMKLLGLGLLSQILLMNYINYIVYDLGNDSIEMIAPIKYVRRLGQ